MKKWCDLTIDHNKSATNLVVELMSEGYKISDWVIDISCGLNSKLKDKYDIWSVSLGDFDFTGPTKIKDFYLKMDQEGYNTLPPEIALILRKDYNDQPKGEWLRIATPLDAMIDSDGTPHLPKLGSALGNYYVETYWAWPDAIFHPHNEFIVEKIN